MLRGAVLVQIREYYDAGGEQRPGKKGIALTLEQLKSLNEIKDAISDKLPTGSMDEPLPEPKQHSAGTTAPAGAAAGGSSEQSQAKGTCGT